MRLFVKTAPQHVMGLLLILLLTGCPPKKKPIFPPEAAAPLAMESETRALEIGTDWTSPSALEPVYFETNRAELRPEARAALKRNAAVLKAVLEEAPSVQVRIEGHCDERNTVEYNLALGQRRADAVRRYYKSLGLKNWSLAAISYGEERPVCSESNENCWWRNRRGETTLKSSSPVRIPADKLPTVR